MINVRVVIENNDKGELGVPYNKLDMRIDGQVVMMNDEETFLSFCKDVWKRYHHTDNRP